MDIDTFIALCRYGTARQIADEVHRDRVAFSTYRGYVALAQITDDDKCAQFVRLWKGGPWEYAVFMQKPLAFFLRYKDEMFPDSTYPIDARMFELAIQFCNVDLPNKVAYLLSVCDPTPACLKMGLVHSNPNVQRQFVVSV